MSKAERRASLFARGILFDPGSGRTREIDTDRIDTSTDDGRSQRSAIERLLFGREPAPSPRLNQTTTTGERA